MKAWIIVPSRGERLIQGGVLTPKPLILIGGKPLIVRAIRAAVSVQANSIACIVNVLNLEVIDFLRRGSWSYPWR